MSYAFEFTCKHVLFTLINENVVIMRTALCNASPYG